jgi:hypothetical protein
MNAQELARNPRLGRFFVRNLNESPGFAAEDKQFDAVLCCVSVQVRASRAGGSGFRWWRVTFAANRCVWYRVQRPALHACCRSSIAHPKHDDVFSHTSRFQVMIPRRDILPRSSIRPTPTWPWLHVRPNAQYALSSTCRPLATHRSPPLSSLPHPTLPSPYPPLPLPHLLCTLNLRAFTQHDDTPTHTRAQAVPPAA